MRHFCSAMVALCGLSVIVSFTTPARAAGYQVTNLTSDIPGMAPNTDPNLKNPWGLGFGPATPFWAGNQFAGNSTLLSASGANVAVGPVVIPPSTPTPAGPTGVVNNSVNGVATGSFFLSNGGTANFIFATLNGNIDAWNPALGTGPNVNAEVKFTSSNNPPASYTGLAIANNGGQSLLYAADNRNGAINVIASNTSTTGSSPFTQITLPATAFTDPTLSSAFKAYNIQLLNNILYVTYQGPNGGAVDSFDTAGTYLGHTASGGVLSSPWGLALAPPTFGQFGGDLLVGNKNNGLINAYDPNTLAFLGTLTTSNGQDLVIPGGLWALATRTGGGFDPNAVYFATGLTPQGGNIFADGLFGAITVVPEPPSAILLGLGVILLGGVCHRAARRKQWRLASVSTDTR